MISSAFIGAIFKVYSWLGVLSFSFTISLSLFTEQYLARSLSSTNFSGSRISDGTASTLIDVLSVHAYTHAAYNPFCVHALTDLGMSAKPEKSNRREVAANYLEQTGWQSLGGPERT
jgi:hypothetical protein